MSAVPVHVVESMRVALDVLVVDDHASMRRSLERLLLSSRLPVRRVLGAATLAQARELLIEYSPGVVLLDVEVGQDDGLSLLPELAGRARVLVLTSEAGSAVRARALAGGARAVVAKSDPVSVLLARLAGVWSGDINPVTVL